MYKKDMYVVVRGLEPGIYQGLVHLLPPLQSSFHTYNIHQENATKAMRLPGELQDMPGARKYVFRTLEEVDSKWTEACLSGEVAKLE
jgi:hypothetical protein